MLEYYGMLIILLLVILVYILANFAHIEALQHAKKKEGIWGMLKISFSIFFHQAGGILVAVIAVIWKAIGL